MRVLNKTGMVLVLFYLTTCLIFLIWDQTITDPKGQFVIYQIPVVFQHAILMELNSNDWLNGASWPVVYLCLIPPTCFALYYLGKLTSTLTLYTYKMLFKHIPKIP